MSTGALRRVISGNRGCPPATWRCPPLGRQGPWREGSGPGMGVLGVLPAGLCVFRELPCEGPPAPPASPAGLRSRGPCGGAVRCPGRAGDELTVTPAVGCLGQHGGDLLRGGRSQPPSGGERGVPGSPSELPGRRAVWRVRSRPRVPDVAARTGPWPRVPRRATDREQLPLPGRRAREPGPSRLAPGQQLALTEARPALPLTPGDPSPWLTLTQRWQASGSSVTCAHPPKVSALHESQESCLPRPRMTFGPGACRSCPPCPRGTCLTAVTSGRPFLPGPRRPGCKKGQRPACPACRPRRPGRTEVDALQVSGRCVRGEPERNVPPRPGDRGGVERGQPASYVLLPRPRVLSGPSAAVDTFPAARAWPGRRGRAGRGCTEGWRPTAPSPPALRPPLCATPPGNGASLRATASAHATREGPVDRVRGGGGGPGRPRPRAPSRLAPPGQWGGQPAPPSTRKALS